MTAIEPFTRADVRAGRVPPLVIENGVVVLPSLRIGAHTLPEHQGRLAMAGLRPLSEPEAWALGYPEDDVDEWFGGGP